jgi:glycosyltransferase involved in cell wall biosynthesis
MNLYPVFLSVVVVVRNEADNMKSFLEQILNGVSDLVSDHELIVVDNASTDDTVRQLQSLTLENGLPNIQVYSLTKMVDHDTATWVGLESALGDFVVVFDPYVDDIDFLGTMLEKAVSGVNVVFANNQQVPAQSIPYRAANGIFNWIFKIFSGVHLTRDAPQYRIMSKMVVNFILQHPLPSVTYRYLPALGGFVRENLIYSSPIIMPRKKQLSEAINRGMHLLVSASNMPIRIVTSLSLFGAIANVIYSFYVLVTGFLNTNVSPGWTSLSLQQSGMFFLISLVLLILGEYIIHMTSLSNEGPLYHIGQEFTSARITRHEKLNIEDFRNPSGQE